MAAFDDMLPQPAASSARKAAQRWLVLALGAMALSALLAVVLVLSRTPVIQELFGLRGAFHHVLVLHVNFAVLVWLLSFGGAMWSLALRDSAPFRDGVGLGLSVIGALLMAFSPFAGNAMPVMSNYIPVLETPLFFTGLTGFLAGLAVAALRLLSQLGGASASVFTHALRASAIAYLVALGAFALHALALYRAAPLPYEALFWGGGHLLQFVYILLLLGAWVVLAGPSLAQTNPASWRRLFWLALLPVAAGAGAALGFHPLEENSRRAFTLLMQWGTPLALLPMAWLIAARHRAGALAGDNPLRLSMGLMLLGMLVGIAISADTVTVTAHYHATNAAITLAFMGLGYRLLPLLGFEPAAARLPRWQLRLYAAGMAVYVAGMACSGWLGVPRKSAGAVDGAGQNLAMAAMGAGGLVAVGATLLFLVVMLRAMRRRHAASPIKSGVPHTS